MPMSIHDGAAWRLAKELHFRDGTTWRKAKEVWVHDGSTWRKTFSGGGVVNPLGALMAESTVFFPSVASAFGTFEVDGNLSSDLVGNWYLPATAGVGSGFWIRAVRTFGIDNPTGPALGQWHQLSTSRSWGLSRSFNGTAQCELAISIATDSNGTNIVATGTLSLVASVEV